MLLVSRGPPRRVSAYDIGFLYFMWISGFLDFKVDFRISKWISGFQSGFLDFKVDFWVIFKVDSGFCLKNLLVILKILLMNNDIFSAQMHIEYNVTKNSSCPQAPPNFWEEPGDEYGV